MATSTKSAAPTGFIQGRLYKTEDGFVYLLTDEGHFVSVHNPSGTNLGVEFSKEDVFDDIITPFIGSITLTEG